MKTWRRGGWWAKALVGALASGWPVGASASESIHDVELGIKLELPVLASAPVIEREQGPGERQLSLGGQVELAAVIDPRLQLIAQVGARRHYLSWPELDPAAYAEVRALRLLVGARASFTRPPTLPTVSAGLGLVSSAWVLDVGLSSGDRRGPGPAAFVAGGVDHFLNPRVALSSELRAWGERLPPEAMAVDALRFESPSLRAGLSLLVGFTFR